MGNWYRVIIQFLVMSRHYQENYYTSKIAKRITWYVENVRGKYFYKTTIKETDKIANDLILSEKIWSKTEELLQDI